MKITNLSQTNAFLLIATASGCNNCCSNHSPVILV